MSTSVTKPFIPKPSFVDQPSLVDSLKYPEKLQDEAQRLITSGAARDMGITAKYLSPQNANSANPKSLQQLMIEEMTKKDFELIAKVIRWMPDLTFAERARREDMAKRFADELVNTNMRFDRNKFLNAATGKTGAFFR